MSNDIIVPYNFTPRDYQLKLYQVMDKGCKRALLRWHRRAGKDKTCWCYLVREAVRKPGVYYYFFPTYQQGRMALWENVDKDGFKTLDHLPKELITRKTNQDMMIELSNGSIIRIVGTDNIDRIVGTNPVGVVFSEYSLQDPVAWTYISPILAENDGWAIFNGTPRGRNHMYKLEKVMENNPKWYVNPLTVEDTGLIEDPNMKEKIEEDREVHGNDYVEQEYWVSYNAAIAGSFYSDQVQKAYEQGRVGYFPVDEYRYVDTFWDLGVDDSTAIWFRQIDGNRLIWVDYYEESGKDILHYVQVLKEKGYNYRTHYLPHDGAQRSIQTKTRTYELLEQCLKEANLSDDVFVCPKMPIQDGINAVRSRFSRYFFDKINCSDALELISLYHRKWDPKREVFLHHPVHDHTSHCADALRTEGVAEELSEDTFEEIKSFTVINSTDSFT